MSAGFIRRGVRRLFGLGIHDPRLARSDAEAELRAFVAAREEQLIAAGRSPEEARTEALRRLGGTFDQVLAHVVPSAQRREQSMRIRDLLDDLRDDLRFVLRSFRREKQVAAFIVLTLALGIGANAAMFGVVDRLLIRGPEHIVEPARVMRVYRRIVQPIRGEIVTGSFGWVSYDLLRAHTETFANVAGYSTTNFAYGDGGDAAMIPVANVNWDYFPLLGVQPLHGRFFNAAEDSPDAPQAVIVLGYNFWRRAFGADPSAVGRTMVLGGKRYAIVGVAPRAFTGPSLQPIDAWIPLALRSVSVTPNFRTAWNAQWLRMIVRLRPGVSPEQAATVASAAYDGAFADDEPGGKEAKIFFGALNFGPQGKEPPEVTISRWLVGVSFVVLLIACANVANLLLARAVRRRREVAVRIALGAGRGRLVRLLLAESTTLALAGGAAGLVVAWAAASLVRNVLIPGIEWPSSPVDLRVLGVTLVIATGVGIVTGLVPALRANQPDLTGALKASARDGGGQTSRLRGVLMVAQTTLSVVLLAGAGLFVRSLDKVRAIDLGLQPDRFLVMDVRYAAPAFKPSNDPAVTAAGNAEAERRTQVLRDAMVRARTLPMVENASLAIGIPFQSAFAQFLRIAGLDSIPTLKGGNTTIAAVADGYFATVGERLIEGRTFTAEDRRGSEPVAIVNRTMATTLWPGKSAVGECIYWGVSKDSLTTCSRVVGVVADAHSNSLKEDPTMNYYVPLGQEKGFGGTSLVVRPREGKEAEALAAVRRLIAEIDPSVSIVQGRLLQDVVEPQMRPWKLGATMFTLMGVLALLVAAVGIYSVMSYQVAQRTREIGVRIALGAQSSSIVSLVLRTSIGLAAAGLAIGTAVALATGKFLQPLLFETSPRDPVVLGGVAATLLGAALAASLIPAVRAKRVNPMEALRAE